MYSSGSSPTFGYSDAYELDYLPDTPRLIFSLGELLCLADPRTLPLLSELVTFRSTLDVTYQGEQCRCLHSEGSGAELGSRTEALLQVVCCFPLYRSALPERCKQNIPSRSGISPFSEISTFALP